MTLVAWTPDDEENWQRMMQTIAQRRPKPEPKPKTAQANNVPSVASPNLPREAFAGVRRPDVSQGLPGAAGVSLAQRKSPASRPEIPAVDPSATSGMNHQDAALAEITAQDNQRYEALKQQRYRGVAPSKNDQIWAKAYEKRMSLGPAATAPETGTRQGKGLLAPQMESGISQPQLGMQPSTGMATTGLGQAGMRAYARWQGLNSEPNSSLLPSPPTGYSSGLSGRRQLSAADYGYGAPAGQNANSIPLAQPAVMSDRDYVESIKRRAAFEGFSGLYGVDGALLARLAGVSLRPNDNSGMSQPTSPAQSKLESELARNRPPATASPAHSKHSTSTQKVGQAYKNATSKQPPSGAHSKHNRQQTREIQDPFFRQKEPTTPLLDFGPGPVKEYIAEQARAFGVPVEIAMAVVEQESNFDINELNKESHDYGLMQINANSWFGKRTGDKYGSGYTIDPYKTINDWKYNVRVGMAQLRDAYLGARLATTDPEEQVRRTYAHYHAAPKNWNKYDQPGKIKEDVDKFMTHYHKQKDQPAH